LLKVPYFTQAYLEDGLTADKFIYHPAVVVIAKEFSKRTFGMIDFISARLEKKK